MFHYLKKKGCTPAMMWLFSRHGSIYPKNDINNPDMQDMIDEMPVYQAQVIANHRAGRGIFQLLSAFNQILLLLIL